MSVVRCQSSVTGEHSKQSVGKFNCWLLENGRGVNTTKFLG